MPEQSLELAQARVIARVECDEELIDEAAPLGRTTFDQLQIIGRENGDAQMTEQIARTRQPLAIDRDAALSTHREFGIDGRDPQIALQLSADARDCSAFTHHGICR